MAGLKELQFRLDMDPPRTTHQEKKVAIRRGNNGKYIPVFYEPPALKAARQELMLRLKPYAPETPIKGPVHLCTRWEYKARTKKQAGQLKITKPDTDNMIKLLKDCMTACGFWVDDAQVCSEAIEKRWAGMPGITIYIACNKDQQDQ